MRAIRRIRPAWVPEKQLKSIGLDMFFAYRDTNSTQFTTCITDIDRPIARITGFSLNRHSFVQHCS
jgi:hypothetical protein